MQILSKDVGTFKPENFDVFRESFATQDTMRIKVIDTIKKKNLCLFNSKWQEYKDWQNNCNTYEGTVMTIGIPSKRESVLKLINDLLDITKHY